VNLTMFYNETTGEVKFFRPGAGRTGLGPEWENIGEATVYMYISNILPSEIQAEHVGGGPKPQPKQ